MSTSPIISRDIVNNRLLFNSIKREKFLNSLRDVVVGDYKWSARVADFRGWWICDGRQLSKAIYPELYSIIGNSFNNPGDIDTTQFRLPDCRGRILAAPGTPVTPNGDGKLLTIGMTFGNTSNTLTVAQMPAHTHTGSNNEVVDTPESETVGGTTLAPSTAVVSGSTQRKLTFTTNATGGGLPHDIQNPTIVLGNVFIYTGYFEQNAPDVDTTGPNDNEYNA